MNTDYEIEKLKQRQVRLELLIAALIASSGDSSDLDSWRFLRRSIRRDNNFEPDFEYLLDGLIRRGGLQNFRHLENKFEEFQSNTEREFGKINETFSNFKRHVEDVDSEIESLAGEKRVLSAETHEWLALHSLGLDIAEARVNRFVPLRIYLSDTPGNAVEAVGAAMNSVISSFGFHISDEFPEIKGSWYKKWFAKTKEAVSQPEVVDRLKKVERALELQALGAPQAAIDEKQASAVATLLNALPADVNAAIQVGSILLIKLQSPNGPSIQVRTLTQKELLHLENNQGLLASPADLLEKLSIMCAPDLKMDFGLPSGYSEAQALPAPVKRISRKPPTK